MKNTKYIAALGLISTIAFGGATAFADTAPSTAAPQATAEHGWGNGKMLGFAMRGNMRREMGIRGTVTAVNGTTITVSLTNPKTKVATSYTIDASKATVSKAGIASTVSAIAVGDTIMANGTINGTAITATKIFDGQVQKPKTDETKKLPLFVGNGQPVVAGNVTAINANTITITNKSNVTYTIDATNAKILKGGAATATIANIAVGDSIVVQGTINGTAIVAASVIDQPAPAAKTTEGTEKANGGFFHGVGNFLKGIFGF